LSISQAVWIVRKDSRLSRLFALKNESIQFFNVESAEVFNIFKLKNQKAAIYTKHIGETTFHISGTNLAVDRLNASFFEHRFLAILELEGDEVIQRIFQGEKYTIFFFSNNPTHQLQTTFVEID